MKLGAPAAGGIRADRQGLMPPSRPAPYTGSPISSR